MGVGGGGGWSSSSKVIKCKFSKSVFLSSYLKKSGILRQLQWWYLKMTSLSHVEARQRSSSAIFSKSIFLSSYICIENAFYTSWEVKISLGSSKLIKCKFSKVYFWAPLWRENILDILGGKNQFRITTKVIKWKFLRNWMSEVK